LPFSTIILARGRSRILAYQAILQLGISVIGNFVLIPRYGAIGGAITLLLVTLAGGLWSIIASYRLMPSAAAQQAEDNHQVLAASE
jgi:O-antigen/teichoic acid export membrane protein